jgi:hypothetical protein
LLFLILCLLDALPVCLGSPFLFFEDAQDQSQVYSLKIPSNLSGWPL